MFETGQFQWLLLNTPLRLKELSSAPAAASIPDNSIALYARDAAGTSNLYFKDDAGVEHNLGLTAGAALTRTNDTNVTVTLGGSPTTALLAATSLTLGWTGTLAVARGGTGLAAVGTALQVLRTNAGATALEFATLTTGITIGDTITSGTTGSVLFVGAGPVLAQDNANFFWDDANNRLGLGTAVPAVQLELTGVMRLVSPTTSTAGYIQQGTDTLLHTLGRVSDGGYSCFAGRGAGNLANTGFNNTGVGEHALAGLTTGSQNTAIGRYALSALTTQTRNVAIGSNTMSNASTNNSVGIGVGALSALTSDFAVAVGDDAALSLTSGTDTTAIGYKAVNLATTGSYNTGIGSQAVRSATGGINTGVGAFALTNVSTGTDNVAIGMNAGIVLTTGDHCTLLGRKADTGANNLTYATSIGSFSTVSNSNYIMLGGTTGLECVGIMGAAKPTTGTGGLIFPDGTALATMASNTAGLYADDIAGNVSMHVINENGNIIKLVKGSTFTQTYATADATLSAYTSDPESSAYIGIDNLQVGTPYAQLTDLNALRVAYETLRVFAEDLAAFVNALVDDHQTNGMAG